MPATNSFKYFESDSFLTLNLTGATTGGRVLLRLTDVSLSIQRDTDETVTFDNGFTKVYQPTYMNWSVSCSGVISSDTGKPEFVSPLSGDSRIIGTYNGLELIDAVKTRTTSGYLYMRIAPSVYQKGKCIIQSMEVSGSAGSKLVFSLQLQGSGDLITSTT
jgi:hypothetical protein